MAADKLENSEIAERWSYEPRWATDGHGGRAAPMCSTDEDAKSLHVKWPTNARHCESASLLIVCSIINFWKGDLNLTQDR
jgi:hypothetical protein